MDLYDWWQEEPRQKERTLEELEDMAHQEYVDRCREASVYIYEALGYLEELYNYGDIVSKRWTSEVINNLRETAEELAEEV